MTTSSGHPDPAARLTRRWPPHWPLQPIARDQWGRQQPTYAAARPALIDAAVKRAEARPSGNWFVLAASRQIRGDRPCGMTVAGVEVVARRLPAPGGAAGAGRNGLRRAGLPLARAADRPG
jgi:hypothetical protein